jgi:hypothetical protein
MRAVANQSLFVRELLVEQKWVFKVENGSDLRTL